MADTSSLGSLQQSPRNPSTKPQEEGTPAKTIAPLPNSKTGGGGGRRVPRSTARSSSAQKPGCVGAYTVQCVNCFKFRLIPTQEEFEEIRQNFIEHPWVCNKKPGASCDDPADLECDSTAQWVIDKPNLPKTPAGCKRVLTMRKDFSKMDALYVMPNGRKVRCPRDVEQFLEANPQYKGQFAVPDFSFTVPKLMDETFTGKPVERSFASSRKIIQSSKNVTEE